MTIPIETREQAEDRAHLLAAECEERLARVRGLIDDLASEVTPLVTRYGELMAVATRLGAPRPPDVREDVTKRLHIRLSALRPYIPFETDPEQETS